MRPLMPPVQTPDNLFHDGNKLTGEPGTLVDAEHLNNEQASIRDVQSELISVLTAAEMEPNPAALQLFSALQILFAQNTDSLGALSGLVGAANKLPYFIAADTAALTTLTSTGRDIIGKNTVADVLLYLGLGDGSMLPVGTPIPWPLATPPTGFLKMNGATFDKVVNPKLALAYPSGTLPDLRAQTIRGWDDGRGVDTGRALLSEQGDAIRNITGSAANVYTGNPDLATGAISYSGTGITSWQSGAGLSISYRNLNFSAATQVPTAAENRVKSVAFNYIVRAQ
ncbi:tail fiber protein [Lelliottia sp. RWM.1]|uniref:tail fiber protein n=1 Tax=Lelliottia sp. RWM.1 TaxID=2663242 RepID=UPI001EF01671|nr:tail fiber protein [Lelliottia sp. RWM.1]